MTAIGVLGLGPAPFVLAGTNIILASYVASNPYQIGRAGRVTFWVVVTLAGGSSITTITVKLQTRYNDGTITTTYIDLASDKGDKGTQQGTLEATHVYAVTAGATAPFRFFLENPAGLMETTINVLSNAVGVAGDSVTIIPVLG